MPFSLVETYDYEYFYQADSDKEQQEASKDIHKKQLIDLCLSGNDKINPNNANNSLFVLEKLNKQKKDSLSCY